jgi:hypothetical protein
MAAFEVWKLGRGTIRSPERGDAKLSDWLRAALKRQSDHELGD